MTRTEYHVVYSSNGNMDMHFGYLPEEHTDVIGAYMSAFMSRMLKKKVLDGVVQGTHHVLVYAPTG